jgi:hypothetical protein
MDRNCSYAALSLGIPPDLRREIDAGDLDAALRRIDALEKEKRLPQADGEALAAMREIIGRLPANFPLTRAQAMEQLRAKIPDFSDAEFDALLDAGWLNWRCIGGKKHFLDSFLDALRLYPCMNKRGLAAEPETDRRGLVDAAMKKSGHLGATVTLKASIAATKASADAACKAWLPIPAPAEGQQSGIEILDAAPGAQIAPEDAPQRTVYWEGRAGDGPFWVKYRYHIEAPYHDADALKPDAVQPAFDTEEQAPHIRFTPYLRALCAQVTAGCGNNLSKARAIYLYVAQNIRYRYQPDYAVMEEIPETCARTGWGDCGVMALVFITLCRIAGIPARWQSGLFVTPEDAGSHDWALFYVAPYGWLPADPSFGSSAFRMGNLARMEHYFGNLDPLRMIANREFYAQLTPPDEAWRSDPYDNQSGEIAVEGRGLLGDERTHSVEVLAYEWDDDPEAICR